MCYFKFGKISFYISDVVMKIFYQSNILSKRQWYSLVLYDMSWERIFKNNIHQKNNIRNKNEFDVSCPC